VEIERRGAQVFARRITPKAVFLAFLALTFVAMACWSFADPLVSAPDEQAHIIRADALDHGQLGSDSAPGDKVHVTVTVPASINFSKIYPDCWHFFDTIPATCSPAWPTSEAPVQTTTYVGHYPPLYYLLAGTGSYVSQEKAGIYAMRLVSSLISALMLALCAYMIFRWSRRRTMAVGTLLALTPMAFFLSASVNPSGFEISTAICLWTAMVIFALDYPTNPPKGLIVILGVSACTLALIRGVSPLWVLLIGLVLAILVGPKQLLAHLRARRDVRAVTFATAVAGVLAVAWIFTQGTLNVLAVGYPVPANSTELHTVRLVLGHLNQWLRESVGVLGWLDTTLPGILYHSWYLLILIVIVAALVRASWRGRIALATVCALAVLVPVAIVTRQAHVDGIVWQGRDSMPLSVGIVILGAGLCGKAARTGAFERWLSIIVVAGISGMDMLAFYTNLRRYAVGRYGAHFFFLHNTGWSPPTGQFLTLAIYGVVTTVIGLLVIAWIWFSKDPLASVEPVAVDPAIVS
jgi:hypothetical protein